MGRGWKKERNSIGMLIWEPHLFCWTEVTKIKFAVEKLSKVGTLLQANSGDTMYTNPIKLRVNIYFKGQSISPPLYDHPGYYLPYPQKKLVFYSETCKLGPANFRLKKSRSAKFRNFSRSYIN